MRTPSLIGLALAAMMPVALILAQQPDPAQPQGPQTPFPTKKFGAAPDEFDGPHGTKFKFPTGLYDENADAVKQIRAARELARRDNRRVLVMWGENNCGFCVFLNDILKSDPKVKQIVDSDYVWIKCDIGKFDKNIELAKMYGADLMATGFGAPALSIVRADDDSAVAAIGGNAMVAKPMTVQRVFDEDLIFEFLVNNRPEIKPAKDFLKAALAKSKSEVKPILVQFTQPGCPECKALSLWLAREDVSKVLAAAFVPMTIDTERMSDARPLLKQAAGSEAIAPPYLVAVEGLGEDIKPVGEIGTGVKTFPKDSTQIAAFMDALKKAMPKLTPDDLQTLERSVRNSLTGEKVAK